MGKIKKSDFQQFFDFGNIELKEAPNELYYEGDIELIKKNVCVSVVGSRDVSEKGKKRAEKITEVLVEKGFVVISGLAKGVDTIAHQKALECNGRTVAVMPCGLDHCTPKSNQKLFGEILNNHLAISQFPEGTKVYKGNFPKRNKVMALFSDATIIIEASEDSGTKHQGWEAIKLNRPLYLLQNIVEDAREGKLSWPLKMMEYGAEEMTETNYRNYLEELKQLSSSTIEDLPF